MDDFLAALKRSVDLSSALSLIWYLLLYLTSRATTFSQMFPGVLNPVRPDFPLLSTQVVARTTELPLMQYWH